MEFDSILNDNIQPNRRQTMSEKIKQIKQVCTCVNCGNEAEMMVTCSLPHDETETAGKAEKKEPQKVKGTGTCSHCGNEAEIWVDF
jgi:hypothetical protein